MTAMAAAIVGGGVAGFRCAEGLRQGGYPGDILVFSDDPIFACNRPVLSKGHLEGTAAPTELALSGRHADGYTVVAERVTGIDTAAGTVHAAGADYAYTHLIVATGIAPSRLPAPAGAPEQLTVRTRDDIGRLRTLVDDGARIAVVGGGTLALETASSLARLGARPVLATRSARPLARLVGDHHAARIAARISQADLEWLQGSPLLEPGALRVGEHTRPVDAVVTAIGGTPEVDLLGAAAGAGGVAVDEQFRLTGLPGVWAVGDIARWADGDMHPHWFAAMESARVATRSVLEAAGVPAAGRGTTAFVHSFWSDQWGHRIQAFGDRPAGLVEHVLQDDPQGVTVGFTDAGGALRGVVAVSPLGSPSPAMPWRARLGEPLTVPA